MENYPKFQNEIGVPIVRIGCREFECIGDKPPQDHPHIYLNMGDANEIVCPYCSTLFSFKTEKGRLYLLDLAFLSRFLLDDIVVGAGRRH